MSDNKALDGKNYNISFFKPTTELATANRNLIIVLLIVWVVAIFGFQILLKVVEKPTPETAYISYTKVWDNIKSEKASVEEKQLYVKSILSVLGKLTLAPADRSILNSSVSEITLQLIGDSQKDIFSNRLTTFKASVFGDPDYQKNKIELGKVIASAIQVTPYSLEAKLLPIELRAAQGSQTNIDKIPKIMSKYLIHNQSFLTDFTFLGFPFHYFYTAVFLLILFVGICLYYCIAIEKIIKRLNIIED